MRLLISIYSCRRMLEFGGLYKYVHINKIIIISFAVIALLTLILTSILFV